MLMICSPSEDLFTSTPEKVPESVWPSFVFCSTNFHASSFVGPPPTGPTIVFCFAFLGVVHGLFFVPRVMA